MAPRPLVRGVRRLLALRPTRDAGVAGATSTSVTYAQVQAIFDRACAGSLCHVGADAPAQGLDLSAGVSLSNLIGIPATEAPSEVRVQPGDPDASYLMCKVDPACSRFVGSRMPLGGELSAEDVATLRAWISGLDAGANLDETAPSFPGLVSAVSSQQASVTLSWQQASDDVSAAADISYRVFVGTASMAEDFASAVATVKGQTSTTVGALSPGRTYYFVVRAVDKAGNSDANAVERAAKVLDATAPTFAGVSSATASGGSSVTLSWLPASDNADASSALRYRVYAATTPAGENFSDPVLTTAAGATSAQVTGLEAATRYYFVVRAVDTSGLEDQNTVERSATTADSTAPVFAGATGAVAAPNSITLSWSAASDDVTAPAQIEYLVYQSSASGGESFAAPTYTTPAGVTSFAVGGLALSTQYYFVVRARDAAGNVDANQVEVTATTPANSDTSAPSFGGATGATAASETQIDLSWNAATDDVSAPNALVYLVYQSASSGGENFASPSYTSAPGATSFSVTGLSPATKHYFVVRARDQAGNIDTNQKEVSATTLADAVAPSFAGVQSATPQSSSSVSLSWNAASDNSTPQAEIVYLVYRATSSGAESYAFPTYTTSAGATTFAATGLSDGTQYDFVVRARDITGNVDGNAVEVSATTPTLSFSGAVQPIFTANCAKAGCHAGVMPAQGLNLKSASSSYSSLVDVLSAQCTSTKRVDPGSPDTSYLIWKLQGSGSCYSGSQMPKGSPPLSSGDLDTIRSWISAGAPNN